MRRVVQEYVPVAEIVRSVSIPAVELGAHRRVEGGDGVALALIAIGEK